MAQSKSWWVQLVTQLSPRIKEGFRTRWSKESLAGIGVVLVGVAGLSGWITPDMVMASVVIAAGLVNNWRRQREAARDDTVSEAARPYTAAR